MKPTSRQTPTSYLAMSTASSTIRAQRGGISFDQYNITRFTHVRWLSWYQSPPSQSHRIKRELQLCTAPTPRYHRRRLFLYIFSSISRSSPPPSPSIVLLLFLYKRGKKWWAVSTFLFPFLFCSGWVSISLYASVWLLRKIVGKRKRSDENLRCYYFTCCEIGV